MPITQQEDLVRHYRWLRRYGLNDSHSGNASIRIGDTIWLTPTGACADTLEPGELLACPLQGEITKGATLDAPLHLAVYRNNADARAVLHSHGPHSVAMTLDGKDYEPPDFEAQHYFGRVPVLSIPYKKYLELSPSAVSRTLVEHPITIVRGHGVYACAPNLNLAYKWICTLELSAQTAYLATLAGRTGVSR